LVRFKASREINTKLFEKDYLSMLEFFSSASQAPINLENADSSAGADYLKE